MVVNSPSENTTAYALQMAAAYNALNGFGIVSGCSISKGTGDWDIDVTSGTVFITGTGAVAVGSGTVTLTAPGSDADMDAGESRIDLITADTGGSLAGVEGTAAADPDYPDIPTDEVLLGFVEVFNDDSTAADSTIFDVPVLFGDDIERYDVMQPPASTSAGSATLGGGWVSEDANQDCFVFGQIRALNTEGTNGQVTVDVDESGGTTPDYTFSAFADASTDGIVTETVTFWAFLPPGGQYQVVNDSDPAGSNSLRFVRVLKLG